MTFQSLALGEPIQRALAERNYTTPSPIQEQTIPLVLSGRDVLGCAQTGTGKTAAFALPILDYLMRNERPRVKNTPRVLVLAPTRELASQIKESFDAYGAHLEFRSTVIFGGVNQVRQERAMREAPDIVVATPGRLLDLLNQRHVSLKALEILVLDEADRMLDMGFIHDVKKVLAMVPPKRQTLFFSATMPPVIQQLSSSILTNPHKVMVTPESSTVEKIEQVLYHVPASRKRELLLDVLGKTQGLTLVFTGMKHVANRVAAALNAAGVPADAIHGNKSQNARERALEQFRTGQVRVLVATDIAARGIDVKGVELVVNFDLPKEPEAYVHRIGRTARAGAGGKAVSFCAEQDSSLLRQIERTIRQSIPVMSEHDFHRAAPAGEGRSEAPPQRQQQQQRGQQGGGRPQQRQGGGGGGGSRGGQSRSQYGNGGGNGGGGRPQQQRRQERPAFATASAQPARAAASAPSQSQSRYAFADANSEESRPQQNSDTLVKRRRFGRYS